MMEYRKVQQIERIGLCDADLLDNGYVILILCS